MHKRWDKLKRTGIPRAALLVAAPGIAAVILFVLVPLITLIFRCISESSSGVDETISNPVSLLARSIAWSIGIGLAATAIGWIPGRALRNSGWWLRCSCFAAALIPAYAIFYCWWCILRPGHPIADYAITHDLISPLRASTLAFALLSWNWPIAACLVGLRTSASERMTAVMLTLDGGSWRDRLATCWRADLGALALSSVAISLITFGETTAFDAAQVATFTSELRAFDAAGATPRQVLIAAIPALAIAVLLSAVAASLLIRGIANARAVGEGDLADLGPEQRSSFRFFGPTLAILFLIIGTALPVALLAAKVNTVGANATFTTLHARGSANALMMACFSGIAGGFIALAGASFMMCDARSILCRVFSIALLALSMPATLLALATASLWRSTALMRTVYDSAIVVSCAEAARFSAVALVIGVWCGAGFARSERETWMVHGRTLGDFLRIGRPIFLASFTGGFLVMVALAATETAVAARLEPPGMDWIATTLLNAIHYQDPSAVSAALPWMALLALGCACVTLALLAGISRNGLAKALMIGLVALVFVGCGSSEVEAESDDGVDSATPRLPTDVIIGRFGRTDGRFQIPRAVAIERSTTANPGSLFVIDKSGRVQRFAKDGTFELAWSMPKFNNGKPTGLTIAPNGLIYVADTHEHQVLIFNRDGGIVGSFASYGYGPGQFIFPSDVAFAQDGRIFVSEYGGNDRVQIFDADGKFISQFGKPGDQPGMFSRPQSIAISNDGSEIFVADSCNHRIQVFSQAGELKRVLCASGRAAGQLAYPYGVCVLEDGTLLVAEFGNCRLQQLDSLTGASRGIWGGGGHAQGRLNAPWSVECVDGRIYLMDTGNGRVQSLPLNSLADTNSLIESVKAP